MINQAETAEGLFPLETWRCEKRLDGDPPACA